MSRPPLKPRRIKASFFAWIVVPILLVGIYQLYGMPHVIWSYSFYGGERGLDSRLYTSCEFVGPYGSFTVPATNRRCGWIAFFKDKKTGAP